MSDENPNPQEPVPPAGVKRPVPPAGSVPVPPAQNPVPPGVAPVPPSQRPVPPAGVAPVPPAHFPVPPTVANPVPPAYETSYEEPQEPQFDEFEQPAYHPEAPNLPPINSGPPPPTHQVPQDYHSAAEPAQKKSGGRRKAGKKKTARKMPAAARPGAYRKRVQQVDSGISFMSVLMAILGLAMLTGAAFALLPKSLDHIKGYPNDNMSNKEPKNLLAIGQKILETRSEDATFTEKEVNDYLNYRLQGSQSGALGGMMKVKGVYVDLRPKEAEIFVERSFPLLGSTTMSVVVKSVFNDQKHQQVWKMGGGSIGRITLKDRSLQPILNVFLRMSKVGAPELEVMNYMADVKLEEDKMMLDSSL